MASGDTGEGRQISDPTSRTMEVLRQQIEALREVVFARLDGIERGIEVAHDDMVRVPTEVQKQVGGLKELHEQRFNNEAALRDEKFAGVQKQIDVLTTQIIKSADDSKVAVNAALQAAKELGAQAQENIKQASEKQDASFSKQIDAQGTLIHAMEKTFDGKITEIKDRLARDTGRGEGQKDLVSTQQVSNSYNVALIGLVVAVIVGASVIIFAILNAR